MLDFSIKEEEKIKTLTINGDLTIQNAAALQGILLSSIEDTETLVINIENITGADLSCLQMLYSAHATGNKSGKHLRLSGNCPEVFTEAAKDAGYLSDKDCGLNCDETCIRTGNSNEE